MFTFLLTYYELSLSSPNVSHLTEYWIHNTGQKNIALYLLKAISTH